VKLVLLHGLGTGPEAWQPQVDALGGARDVLTPRLVLDDRFTIQGEAERLRDELPGEPVELCGLSLGALVALRMAVVNPDRVRRLVLCAGFARLPPGHRLLQALVGTAASLAPARARRELGDLDSRALRAVFREGRRFDASGELARVTMPTLVLVGERDRPNTSLAQALAGALPDARFEVVPGAGHAANVDAPAVVSTALRAFLDA